MSAPDFSDGTDPADATIAASYWAASRGGTQSRYTPPAPPRIEVVDVAHVDSLISAIHERRADYHTAEERIGFRRSIDSLLEMRTRFVDAINGRTPEQAEPVEDFVAREISTIRLSDFE